MLLIFTNHSLSFSRVRKNSIRISAVSLFADNQQKRTQSAVGLTAAHNQGNGRLPWKSAPRPLIDALSFCMCTQFFRPFSFRRRTSGMMSQHTPHYTDSANDGAADSHPAETQPTELVHSVRCSRRRCRRQAGQPASQPASRLYVCVNERAAHIIKNKLAGDVGCCWLTSLRRLNWIRKDRRVGWVCSCVVSKRGFGVDVFLFFVLFAPHCLACVIRR